MHRNVVGVVVLGLGVAVLGGCDVDEEFDDIALRSEVDNGVQLNSAILNGVQLNGVQLNGVQLNGVQLNGVQLNGVQLNGVQLNGSAFTGTVDLGAGPLPRAGVDLIGAEMTLTSGAGSYTLRFDDIHKNPAQPTGDVYFYAISWRDDAVGTWSSLCRDSAGNPALAIPIANYWNTTTGARTDNAGVVTFACRGAVLAKCVEWGYVPWKTANKCDDKGKNCVVVSLRDHHQACTRMARADYCGDGRSYTFNGTPIDLYDKLTPQIQARSTSGAAWKVEAEWGVNGATCVGDELRLDMYDTTGTPYTYPTCISTRKIKGCGDFKGGRVTSLVADAYCDKWTTSTTACGLGDEPPPPPPPH